MLISLNGQIPHQLNKCRHFRLFQLLYVKVKRKYDKCDLKSLIPRHLSSHNKTTCNHYGITNAMMFQFFFTLSLDICTINATDSLSYTLTVRGVSRRKNFLRTMMSQLNVLKCCLSSLYQHT